MDVILQSQLAAQTVDMYINGATFPNISTTPCGRHKLAAGERSAAMSDQSGQQGKFLIDQAKLMSGAVYAVGGKINGKIFIRSPL